MSNIAQAVLSVFLRESVNEPSFKAQYRVDTKTIEILSDDKSESIIVFNCRQLKHVDTALKNPWSSVLK